MIAEKLEIWKLNVVALNFTTSSDDVKCNSLTLFLLGPLFQSARALNLKPLPIFCKLATNYENKSLTFRLRINHPILAGHPT